MSNEQEFIEAIRELGLSTEDVQDLKKVRKKYHEKAKKHHPDAGGDPKKFRLVHHSYKLLTDPSYRDTCEKDEGMEMNLNANVNIAISFSRAFFGDKFSMTANVMHVDELGKPVTIKEDEDVHLNIDVIRLTIKPGTKSGDRVTIKGKGLQCREAKGDLIVSFNVEPHTRFQLRNLDIFTTEKIPLDLMLTGGEFDVLTMWGIKTIMIPPGTIPNDELSLPNCGVEKRGKHIIQVHPLFPTKEELKQKNTWQKLGINWEDDVDNELTKNEEEWQKLFEKLGGKISESEEEGYEDIPWFK